MNTIEIAKQITRAERKIAATQRCIKACEDSMICGDKMMEQLQRKLTEVRNELKSLKEM